VLAIALANKLARIAWAVLNKERNFEVTKTTAPQPSLRKRDTVLGTVKAWPANGGARTKAIATASLDRPYARCPARRAGRDEGTASRREQRNCTKEAGAMT
jgi:hypothetical protein